VFLDSNPPTHEQGTDRPGRAFSSVGHGRSSLEPTDWHDIEAHKFADHVAAALERLVRERGVAKLVIAAPPRTLAELRKAFHADMQHRIIAEIAKDLTRQPIYEI
jgi:protein required for attachment to host cells